MARDISIGLKSIFIVLFSFLFVAAKAQKSQFKQIQALSQQHPDSALLILKRIYAAALAQHDILTEGLSLQHIGLICFHQGHYTQALEFSLKADNMLSLVDDKNYLANNLVSIGILYYYNKQKNLAKGAYNKALKIYQQRKNIIGQAEVYGNIGHLFEKESKYDSAFYYQNLALLYYNKANYKQGAAKIHENIGSIYEDLAKYDLAYLSFKKSLQLYHEENDKIGSIEVLNNLGDILRKTGKHEESIIQTKKALALAQQTKNLYQLSACNKDLGKAFSLLNRMDSAYHYAELGRKYTTAIYSKENVNQTAFLQVLYDFNKKSDEITRLNNNRKFNQIIIISTLIVTVLLIVLGFVIYSRQRLKIREQQTEAKQKEVESELLASKIKNQHLEEEKLKGQLDIKGKELSAHTLNLIRNNQFLEHMRSSLQAMVKDEKRDQKRQMQKLIIEINESITQEQYWKEFTLAFEQVHQSFFERLKEISKDLTAADIRLIALLKINLNSTDISTLLGISNDSLRVARYRLRKKLNISQGDNLSAFVQSI